MIWPISPRRLALLTVVSTALLGGSAPAGAAGGPTLHRGVSVWMPYWAMSAATSSVLSNTDVIGTASPFWYSIQGDARIHADRGAGDRALISRIRSQGVRVVPTVRDEQSGTDFGAMGTSASRRAAHVSSLMKIATSRSYDGLDLNYEQPAVNTDHNGAVADRAQKAMTAVATDTCRELHRRHKTCIVTVMARTTDTHVYFRGRLATWIYDYKALNKVADKVRVMAYGEHAPSSAPGPIASLTWTKSIIAYTRANVAARKVELGLPAYGQDWSSTANTGITSRAAAARATQHHVSPRYDPTARELTYSYVADGVKHTVWYGDSRSINDRTSLARAAGFTIALWAAGQEQTAVWPKVRKQLTY